MKPEIVIHMAAQPIVREATMWDRKILEAGLFQVEESIWLETDLGRGEGDGNDCRMDDSLS